MTFKEFHTKEQYIAMGIAREPKKLENTEVVIKTPLDVEYEVEMFSYDPKELKLVIHAKRRSPVEVM